MAKDKTVENKRVTKGELKRYLEKKVNTLGYIVLSLVLVLMLALIMILYASDTLEPVAFISITLCMTLYIGIIAIILYLFEMYYNKLQDVKKSMHKGSKK